MPRILCLTGESDRSECGLFEGLHSAGYSPLILGSIADKLVERLKAAHIEVKPCLFRSKIDFRAICTIRKLITQHKPDLVHAFTGKALANAIIALIGTKVPLVAYRGTMGHLGRWDPTSWLTFLNPRINALVCVSEAVARYLRTKGIPEKKLQVIYKGHSAKWYSPQDRADLSSFSIPSHAKVICAAANMRPVKGIDVLVKAASLLPRDGSIHYLLIGEPRDSVVPGLIRELGLESIMHLIGYRADAISIIAASDLVAVPSRAREGFPKALIEAMMLGKPVVASAVGGIPEIISDGNDGILVPPDDPDVLAQALRSLLTDSANAKLMGFRAREKIMQQFTIERTVRETDALYRKLLG